MENITERAPMPVELVERNNQECLIEGKQKENKNTLLGIISEIVQINDLTNNN